MTIAPRTHPHDAPASDLGPDWTGIPSSYHGAHWLADTALPAAARPWLPSRKRLLVQPRDYVEGASAEEARSYLRGKAWVWPRERLLFFSDVHADVEAFLGCLVASGGIEKTGPGTDDYALTREGRAATFLIAGDCFDKGPANLPLLRALKALIDRGANVVILAGNHDVRALLGMACVGNKDPRLAHLFVRMGKKSVPLFQEIVREYLPRSGERTSLKREHTLHKELFPPERWYEEFPGVAAGLVPPRKIEHELKRIREKTQDFESHCARQNLSLAQVRAAVDKFHELFLEPSGEFHWYYDRMQLGLRRGSLLFIHGGVDDHVAGLLAHEGIDGLNARFRAMLREQRFFELYHGPIGNTFRTKYRDTDFPLTPRGLASMHAAGIYAIAHGHRNIPHGQRAIFRCGMLNFECDASVDINTRRLLDLAGNGAASTVFLPDARIVGISTDYPTAKVFDPADYARMITLV